MKHLKGKVAGLVAMMLGLAACSDDADSLYLNSSCNFTFYTATHPTSNLTAALNNDELYTIVTTKIIGAGTYPPYAVICKTYGLDTTTDNITTAEETQRRRELGLNNGLIIGRMIMDHALVAYDLQCPNCFNDTGIDNHALDWAGSNNIVACATCKRTYNLSNSGVVASGEGGRQLFQYRTTFTGQLLHVYNQ